MVVVGLDVGTTFVKAARVTPTGRIEALSVRPVPGGGEGAARLDGRRALGAALSVLSDVLTADVAAIGCSALMHTLLPVDDRGEVRGLLTTWQDQSAVEAAALLQRGSGRDWWAETGTPVHPMSPAVRWWAARQRGEWEASLRPRALKDVLIRLLTGEDVTDWATAAAGGFLDRKTRAWHAGVLAALELAPKDMPTLVGPRTVVGRFRGIPVVVGTTDGVAAHLGLGCRSDEGSLSLGTSGAVRRLVVDRGQPAHRQGLFAYAVDETTTIIGGALNDAGNLLAWWAQILGRTVAAVVREALLTPAGPGSPLVVPFWHGARAPFWDAGLRGQILGLTQRHGRADISGALVEAVVFLLARTAEQVETLLGAPSGYRAGGGLMRDRRLVQAVATAVGRPVGRVTGRDPAVLGAARLAYDALGVTLPRPRATWVAPTASPGVQARYAAFVQAIEAAYRERREHLATGVTDA